VYILVQSEWRLRLEFITMAQGDILYQPPAKPPSTTPIKITIPSVTSDREIESEDTSKSDHEGLSTPEPLSTVPTMKQAVSAVNVDAFDCELKIRVYAGDWDTGRMFNPRQRFEMINDEDEDDGDEDEYGVGGANDDDDEVVELTGSSLTPSGGSRDRQE
jgi:hypothetical protein